MWQRIMLVTFLDHFAPVSLRMARDQGLSLNPTKLNGACGRLMCCLQFEKDVYEDAHRRLPKVGKRIRTPAERESYLTLIF